MAEDKLDPNEVDVLMESCLDLEKEIEKKKGELDSQKAALLSLFEQYGVVKNINPAGHGYQLLSRVTSSFTNEAKVKVKEHDIQDHFVSVNKKTLDSLKKKEVIDNDLYHEIMACQNVGSSSSYLKKVTDKELLKKAEEAKAIPF